MRQCSFNHIIAVPAEEFQEYDSRMQHTRHNYKNA